MLREILESRDIEQYKQFTGYDAKSDFERDWATLEFDSMCRSHHKEWQSPAEMFTHRMNGILHLAVKYGVDPLNLCGELTKQLERRHK